MNLTQEKLDKIIKSHGKWLHGEGGERADLSGMDLHGTNLCRADLREANLCGANLRGANLSMANLCGADLHGADLYEADLSGADLWGTNLCKANLHGANLHRADLRGADLSEAYLNKADLCMAILNEKIIQVGPIGSRRDYITYNVTCDIVQCGCWRGYKGGTLDEFVKRVDEVYPASNQYGDDYRKLITFLRMLKGK